MTPEDYLEDSARTVSPGFHIANVPPAYLVLILNRCIEHLEELDLIKKALFYDRKLDRSCFTALADALAHSYEGIDKDVLHGIIGKATEGGELLEALRNALNGKPLDRTNVLEEVGDGFWYDALILRALKSTFAAEFMRNIAKLFRRFPDKFSNSNANNRDLFAERDVLENGAK